MIVRIRVKLHSSNPRLEKIAEGKYIAYLSERPEKGRANFELVKLLSKEFFVPQDKIDVKTPTAREKVVEIAQ